jgi:metal-sulfur cluster biosynthetic enzyme
LETIIDPDFGMNIVDCGFVKDMSVDTSAGSVYFRLELTTPACPIKDEFEQKAYEVVNALDWVQEVRSSIYFSQIWNPHSDKSVFEQFFFRSPRLIRMRH